MDVLDEDVMRNYWSEFQEAADEFEMLLWLDLQKLMVIKVNTWQKNGSFAVPTYEKGGFKYNKPLLMGGPL